MKKRIKAQANIITIILIILLIIAAIIIVWNLIYPLIKGTSGKIDISAFSYKGEISYLLSSDDSAMSVTIERKSGEGNITGIKIILEDVDGISHNYQNNADLPKELETKTYLISNTSVNPNIKNFSNITKISFYFIYLGGDGKNKTTPSIGSTDRPGGPSGGPNSPACTPEPASTTCESRVCGLKLNNCNIPVTCTPGCPSNKRICNSGTCVACNQKEDCGTSGCNGNTPYTACTSNQCILAASACTAPAPVCSGGDCVAESTCTPTCGSQSQCAIGNTCNCNANYGDCNANKVDGCEVNTLTDINNCGTCTTVCLNPHGTTSCSLGLCAPSCNLNYGDCDSSRANGCESNLLTNHDHCGTCTTVCGIGETCTNGVCGAGPVTCYVTTECGTSGCDTATNKPYSCTGGNCLLSTTACEGAKSVCKDGNCIECNNPSDCGTNGLTGNKFCLISDLLKVYKEYKTYSCTSPGTTSSDCSSSNTDQVQDNCISPAKCVPFPTIPSNNAFCCADQSCTSQGYECGVHSNGCVGSITCGNGGNCGSDGYSCTGIGKCVYCGDDYCDISKGENTILCPVDCGCGDGSCDYNTEDCDTCSTDCGCSEGDCVDIGYGISECQWCGDLKCNNGEDCTCLEDCECSSDKHCSSGTCVGSDGY